jgi:hypothetical protein
VSIYTLPVLGSVISMAGMLAFHGLLVVFAIALARRRPDAFPAALFPLLLITYVAALTSIVEYSENMRFRLAVEPLLWVLGLLAVRALALMAWGVFGRSQPPAPAAGAVQ